MKISIRDGDTFYYTTATPSQGGFANNGALISCGLTVGKDITAAELASLKARGLLTEVTQDEWNHSGCQSSCIRRGAAKCSW